MDLKSQFLTLLEQNQKKIAWSLGGCLLLYFSFKMFHHKPAKKPELTAELIRRIIKDLPFDCRTSDTNLRLKDLLDELKDLNEDEEWKELITSVKNFYDENREM